MDGGIASSCGRFVTTAQAEEVENWFQDHPLPNNKRRISQLVEVMKANGAFLDNINRSKLVQPSFWA